MFFPKRVKYKKYRKGSIKGFELKNKNLKFGFYGLKSLESGRITAKQIETVRQAVQRKIKPYGKIWVRIFAHLPVSSKPSEVRMGKGKGNFSYWSGVVKKGQILFEISGVSKEIAFYSLKLGSDKLPFKTKIVTY
jgi:large subunit ribosomal protein L16